MKNPALFSWSPHGAILGAVTVALTAQSGLAGGFSFRGQSFEAMDGYTLSLAAEPPLVDRPIEADFDDRGRLYVTESSGSNAPVAEQVKTRPHRVLRLEDGDGDGKFDRRTVFADGLMFPEGVMWLEKDSILVAACPQIWKLTDTDGDGVADTREVWFDGKTLTGCANDLHGPYRGPDGWIYWCKGAFAEQTYTLAGRADPWKTRASHVFRAHPDGSGIEPVFTAGMDNPVGLAWTPERDLIVSGTFFQHPGGGRRDGLIHAVYGGVWGKDHDVLQGHPRTGDLMPPMTHLGPAAPCGLVRYDRDLLCCQFNMRKVSRHRLIPDGATYRTEDTDFLVSDHPDFHPTDVLQAPDGSVLVVDTGGWYKLCCPTSQLAKPDVLGAIYRLKRTAGEISTACPAPRYAMADVNDEAAQLERLRSSDPQIRRAAAEALGRFVGRTDAAAAGRIVGPLFEALAAPEVDRFLFHSLSYALSQMAAPDAVKAGLKHDSPRVRAACLYAMEARDPKAMDPAATVAALTSADAGLRQAGFYVAKRHGEFVSVLKPWIGAQLAAPTDGGAPLAGVLGDLCGQPEIAVLMAQALATPTVPADARRTVLRAMEAAAARQWHDSWTPALVEGLASASAAEVRPALGAVRAAGKKRAAAFAGALAGIATSEAMDADVRLQAATLLEQTPDSAIDLALSRLEDPAADASLRRLAAEALGRSRPGPDQLTRLANLAPRLGFLEWPLVIHAFSGCSDEAIGRKVASAVAKAGVLKSLTPKEQSAALGAFPDSAQHILSQARSAEYREAKEQQARLDELEGTLPPGDANRGSLVFQSAKGACTLCHQIGYKGGQVGPDLSKVGAVRTRRDLLEAVVFPSASFVRSYEPVSIAKKDGSVVGGIVKSESGDALTLVIGAGVPEMRVPLAEVATTTPSALSLMPAGLDQVLSPQELADVLAFLASMK